ncbi:MAG: hypothetical protein D4R97_01285 [Bacteroidetes bacterium]|nr:MAG: hypothetical protein D4R97_01285 [Bacteroidota bacterium]
MKSFAVHLIIPTCFSLLFFSFQVRATQFIFGPDKLLIDGRGNASAVKPGDTIYLSASTRQYVLLRSLHGTASLPILVQNLGGSVILTNSNYGIKFDTCSWIKCVGKANGGSYGFIISSVNAGVAIQGLSTSIEIAGIEIFNATWTGILAKTDPDCSFKSTRGNYVMRNISIHDNYLHDIANEGMYIGHSYFNGYTIHCNGKDTTVYPHLIRGLKVFNNRVENTGWDGIQVSSADSACYLNNNLIYGDSWAQASGQMSGFLLGGGSSCNCYSNLIKDGRGDGIDELGQGGNYIYNNLILNPGKNFTGSGQKHGIYVGSQSPAAGRGYHLIFNTIVSPRTNGIDFRNTAALNSVASDNIIANPGNTYIKTAAGTTLAQQDNLQVAAVADAKFINPSIGNYDLQPSSPAVNTGSAVTGFLLNFDISGRSRPWPVKYDIGAFECHDSSLLSVNEKHIVPGFQIIRCYLQSGMLKASLNLAEKNALSADIYSLNGSHISTICSSIKGPGLVEIESFVGRLENACYICIFRFAGSSLTRKIYAVSF